MDKKTDKMLKTTIYLHKKEIRMFEECLKEKYRTSECVEVKPEVGLEGRVYVDISSYRSPKWKSEVDSLAVKELTLVDSASNKVVVILKVNDYYMSLVYGYGKSMLDESSIERNFGLKVAANLINPTKILTMDATVVESSIVKVAKQGYKLGTLDDFHMEPDRDIMRGLMGNPGDDTIARMLYGKDALIATRRMKIIDIKDSLMFYLSEYRKKTYRDNGFAWLDNIVGIKDTNVIDALNSQLVKEIEALKVNPYDLPINLTIAPNQLMDWQNIDRIYIYPERFESDDSQQLEYWPYLKHIAGNTDIIKTMKKDKIMAVDNGGEIITLSNVYDGVLYETNYVIKEREERYILLLGSWYKVDNDFYSTIKNNVSSIQQSNIEFPTCGYSEHEGDYNNRVVSENTGNPSMILLDCKNYSVGNKSRVEPCDILTSDLEFIHVKKGETSSNLSHLFSQGYVSASLFKSDSEYKKFIEKMWLDSQVEEKLKTTEKLKVVYAIITTKDVHDITEAIPFFSLVTLERMYQNYKIMDVNCYVNLIKKEKSSDNNQILGGIPEKVREEIKKLLASKPGKNIREQLDHTTDEELDRIYGVSDKTIRKLREQ